MKQLLSFYFLSKLGRVQIIIGQCYRPNSSLKKINHFQSANGYSRWIVAVAKDVKLSYVEIEIATQKAMALVATGVANSTVVQEVA